MSSKKVYDLCVLGGGPGGWAGAVRAWDLGRKVCLVERREGLGGAAVWGGAMGKHVMQEVGKVSIMKIIWYSQRVHGECAWIIWDHDELMLFVD